jgi:hypothetical protein
MEPSEWGESLVQQAFEIDERTGSPGLRNFGNANLGIYRVAQGRPDLAVELLEESRHLTSDHAGLMDPLTLTMLARARRENGELELARDAIDAALASLHGAAILEVYVQIERGHVAVAQGAPDAASELARVIDRTRVLVAQTEAVTCEPWIYELEALQARLQGDTERWREQLTSAQRMFSELGVKAHADRVAGDLGAGEQRRPTSPTSPHSA